MSLLRMLLFLFPSIVIAQWNVLEEGDILIPVEVRGLQDGFLPPNKWPEGIVQYKISPSFSLNQIQQIKQAMAEIEQKTCVRFKEGYIGSHVNFVPGHECGSYIGNIGWHSGQALYLAPGCFSRHAILHEIMHALGFIHEATRPDRDDYLIVHTTNIEPFARFNFAKKPFAEKTLMESEYAYDSIMHYGPGDFAINPELPVLVAKRPFKGVMGGGNQLSPVDVDRINALYKCPTFTRTTTKVPVNRLLYLGPDIPKISSLGGRFCSPIAGYRSDPTNCFMYLECVLGRYMSRPCAPGTSFHADRGVCDFVNISKCG